MELLTRRLIMDMEGGDPNAHLDEYAEAGSERYNKMVEKIRERFGLTSLKFSTIESIVKAIGLPKCKICTHCFDGSSYFHSSEKK
ncbi:MAG: hypothetical protein K2J06_03415 [Muribaculaceae bacterium]|nr:hypothetical protein [Muribaculaceae bacterium]